MKGQKSPQSLLDHAVAEVPTPDSLVGDYFTFNDEPSRKAYINKQHIICAAWNYDADIELYVFMVYTSSGDRPFMIKLTCEKLNRALAELGLPLVEEEDT